jgi:hypothetical protein
MFAIGTSTSNTLQTQASGSTHKVKQLISTDFMAPLSITRDWEGQDALKMQRFA